MTDSTEGPPKAKRLPPLPPVDKHHRDTRKRLHLLCFLVFLALPFTNMMRFDLPRQRVYLAGVELWISEFSIIFFSLMFLMFLIAASAIVYGRIYCSYACPQMIFSEWSASLEAWAAKIFQVRCRDWSPARKRVFGKGLFYLALGVASVFLAFIFTSYFLSPRDLLGRLLHLDLATVGGITGATVTVLVFLDLTLVRQKFCTTICPYGYLQGMLQDKHTLLVSYQDETQACIHCNRCVKVCEMGIDIRESPFQIECVHCGDCVDACEDILRKAGHPGLIHYTWGDKPGQGATVEPLAWRVGLRDGKRWVLLLLLCVYLCALGAALSMRRPVLVNITMDRGILYKVLPDGRVMNRVRLDFANRSSRPSLVKVWVEGLPGGELALEPVSLAPGASMERIAELRVKPFPGARDVNPFRILAQTDTQRAPDSVALTFIMPVKGD